MNFRDVVGPILAEFEGCPEALAVDALRNAFIDFCKGTYGWQTGVRVMSDATVTANTEVHVIDIVDARIEGASVCITFANADDNDVDPSSVDYVIRFADPNAFEITPAPATPVEIALMVIAAPLPTATSGPDHIWNGWHEALRAGAIGRLHMTPAKPWAIPGSAAGYLSMFERAKRDAAITYSRNRRNRGRVLRVRPAA